MFNSSALTVLQFLSPYESTHICFIYFKTLRGFVVVFSFKMGFHDVIVDGLEKREGGREGKGSEVRGREGGVYFGSRLEETESTG